MTATIYALIDPRTGECRYVGKTKARPERRLAQHINDARRKKFEALPRFRWIKSLQPLAPRILVLEECVRCWREAEAEWIAVLRREGARLLNCTNGGEGIEGFRHSAETKAKMSASAIRIAADLELKARRTQASVAARLSPGVRARQSTALRAAFARPEVKARLSAAQKASVATSPERSARLGNLMRGRAVSEETREKLRYAALLRAPLSQLTRAKMAASRTGRKHSPETIEKIRAAAKNRKPRP